ncbi:MAG: hypothetical protein QW197_01490 [Candidatus Aenigmatarchaeota archaeon]
MVELLLPDKLIDKIKEFLSSVSGKKVKLDSREFIISPMNPYILDFTNLAGKNTEIIYSIVFGYGKKSFDVFKVGESLYVSTNYQPHYNNIRRQKEEIENNIKAQLAQIANAITDTQLISHDYRKYKHFVNIFRELDEINKKLKEEKDENKRNELQKRKRELEITLRNIYIDQVDIHTGDLSIVNMARTRWTTFIADFLSLEDEKTPEDVLKKLPNITMAEAIQLAKKNSLFLYWLEEFRKVVFEREAELRKLLIMRKNSIENYKEMLRPLIARYLAIKEEPVFFTSSSVAFIKSATYPMLIDSTKFWLIKSIPPFMKEEERIVPKKITLERAGILIDELKKLIDKENISKIEEYVLPTEPSIDRVVLAGIEVINENFGTNFTINDIIEIRDSIVKKSLQPYPSKERWKLSPYYVFVEISLDRTLLRSYTGIEIEDFWFEIKPYLISQNLAMLMYLQTKALDKYIENQINSFFGESLEKTVEIDVGNQKRKVKVLLDINFLDEVLEEEFLKEKSKRYEIIKKYNEAFENTFIKNRYLLYEKSIVDEYFFDYVVNTKLDIDRTIASAFGFPI